MILGLKNRAKALFLYNNKPYSLKAHERIGFNPFTNILPQIKELGFCDW